MKTPRPPRPARPGAALSKARIADLRNLRDKRKRTAAGRFLIEGFHIVEEALLAGAPVEEVLVGEGAAKSFAGARIVAAAKEAGLPVTEAPRRVLEVLADADTPQGVIAVVRAPDPAAPLPLDRAGIVVLLDGVQDPGNAGAIVRAADAFGCAAVVFCRGTVEPLNPKVLRAAQGSHFHVAVVAGPSAEEVAVLARRHGHTVLATLAAGGSPLFAEPRVPARTTVVFGNEARGVSDALLAAADRRVTIPQRGRAESLGVAAAAAVVLAWIGREGGTA